MFEPLLSQVTAIAREAGRAIMVVYEQPDAEVTLKSDQSPLTAADLASHQAIVSGLQKLQPNLPVLSEESTHTPIGERSGWRQFWLVDPLDGTKEFIKRNGEFTVNIALIEDGRPILGVVYAPALNVCYYGARGAGSYVQRDHEPPTSIRAVTRPKAEPTRVVASRSHSDARTTALLERLGKYECISMGSSLKLCLVAEGEAHLYPRLGPTMEWDTAAAHAVVNEAGGMVCDLSGSELVYNKEDLHNPEFFVLARAERELLTTIRNCL